MSLHPHDISQKTEAIIEHFREHVRKEIGGRAKAMVATRSRLHAVRYKLAFDKWSPSAASSRKINELFGTDFKPEEQLFLEHMVESGKADPTVRERARANTCDNFALSIKDLVQNLVIDGLDRHDQLATSYLTTRPSSA